MSSKYDRVPKSEMELAYLDTKDAARAEVRRIVRRIEDRLNVEIDRVFAEAIVNGETIEVRPDLEAIKQAAAPIIRRELEA